MSDEVSAVPSPADVAESVTARTFTQSEVNEIVQGRLKNMRADYEQLQAQVATVEDLESHNQKLTSELSSLQMETLRMRIAAEFGINASDRDVLLTATDEGMLRMQAERFSSVSAQRDMGGNRAPKEGQAVRSPSSRDGSTEAFVRELFDRDPWD